MTTSTLLHQCALFDKYVLRFEASQIPETKAFWSLTLYDKDFYLPKDLLQAWPGWLAGHLSPGRQPGARQGRQLVAGAA